MENFSFKDYPGKKELDEIDVNYVLPLNHWTIRKTALATIEGREAIIDPVSNKVIISPFVDREIYVVDDNGHLVKNPVNLTVGQCRILNKFQEYVNEHFSENVVYFEPDSYENRQTQQLVISCMENFLLCLSPGDYCKTVFQDILRNSPNPALELIYNVRRLGEKYAWERHFLVWKIATINQALRIFYYNLTGEMKDFGARDFGYTEDVSPF